MDFHWFPLILTFPVEAVLRFCRQRLDSDIHSEALPSAFGGGSQW